MFRIPIIITVFIFLAGQLTEATISIEFDPIGLIREGDDLTISCSVPEYKRLEILKLVKIIDGQKFDVAVIGQLTDTYKSIPRYSVLDSEDNLRKGEQVVRITGILGADRGEWMCEHSDISNEKKESALESIAVIVPPASLVLSQKTPQGTHVDVESGETLLFAEGEEAEVQCVVTMEGTIETPTVLIKLGEEDVTSTFVKTEDQLSVVVDGLYKEKVDVTYSGYTTPKPEDSGKELSCTASAENHSDTLTSTVTVEVDYAPKLSCGKSEVMAEQGAETELKCMAEMMPKYESATWAIDSKSINPDEESQDGNLHFMTSESENSFTFILHVKSVQKEDFGTYTLTVTNSQGTATQDVSLNEVIGNETTTPEPTSTTVKTNDPGTVKGPDNGCAALSPLTLLCLLLLTALPTLL